MAEAQTSFVKYVFLDIAGFTRNRSVEAQAEVVALLNQLVLEALNTFDIKEDKRILIPTGDGMCIALVEITKPFDIHLLVALEILAKIQNHNNQTKDAMRQFWVRIGLNENVDNLVTDINGKLNVAGMGISMAQRIMTLADAGQILVGETVHETLRAREKYMSVFRGFHSVVKHGEGLRVYQYIAEKISGLYIQEPSAFKVEKQAPKKLSEFCAYYIAHALQNQNFFLSQKSSFMIDDVGAIVLFFLASDSVQQGNLGQFDVFRPHAWKAGKVTISAQFDYYSKIDFWVIQEFGDFISSKLSGCSECFDYKKVFITPVGVNKLKEDWPDVAKKFGIQ